MRLIRNQIDAEHPVLDAKQIETDCARHRAAFSPYEEVFDLWEKAGKRRPTTVEDYRKVLAAFASTVERKELAALTRKDVIAFRDRLLAEGQSPTTATRKVGIVRTLFRVALDYELLETNPAEQVRIATPAARKPRVGFTVEDLNRIFSSEIYREGLRPLGGGKEAAFWLPLIALYTGARVEELAQLLVEDVHYDPSHGYFLNITDEAAHSQLKNAASRRRIPVHPVLIDCGLLDYVETVRERRFLFPDLKANPRGKLGGYFSNFFSGYLRSRIKITDRRKVFHSFRHTFKDVCRSVGIDEAVHDALTGHTAPGAGRRYGNDQYPLAPLFEAMERFDIPGLDLSHLCTRPRVRRAKPVEAHLISAYYGIIVSLCRSTAAAAASPFVFVRAQGAEATITIEDNRVVHGELPFAKLVLVQAWIEIHREALMANWENGQLSGEFFQIDPLR